MVAVPNERTPAEVRDWVDVMASDDPDVQLAAIESAEKDGELQRAAYLRRYFNIQRSSHVCTFPAAHGHECPTCGSSL